MTLDVTTPESDRQTARSRHTRWQIPVLAATVVAAAGLGVTAVATSSRSSAAKPKTPASQVAFSAPGTSAGTAPVGQISASTSISTPSTPGASTTAPTAGATRPAPVLLANGAQQSRAHVPWNQVGRGWFLAVTNSTAPALYLINPIGGRYLITDRLPNARDYIVDWSPDGKRVMLARDENSDRLLTELELATGRVLSTFNIGESGFQAYTRPNGHAILVIKSAGGSESLERLGTDGSHQLTYPERLPGFGRIGFPSLYNADGSQLLVGGQHGIALLGNDGHLIRVLPAPPGAQGCWPAKWWNTSTVLETCNFDLSPRYALLLQAVAGGQPERLVGANKSYPLGFADAWKYSGGILLSEGSGCGPGRLDVLRQGVITRLALPAGVQDSPPVMGVAGDVVTLRRLGGCPVSEDSMVSLNLVTGATSTLFKGSARLIPYPWQ